MTKPACYQLYCPSAYQPEHWLWRWSTCAYWLRQCARWTPAPRTCDASSDSLLLGLLAWAVAWPLLAVHHLRRRPVHEILTPAEEQWTSRRAQVKEALGAGGFGLGCLAAIYWCWLFLSNTPAEQPTRFDHIECGKSRLPAYQLMLLPKLVFCVSCILSKCLFAAG